MLVAALLAPALAGAAQGQAAAGAPAAEKPLFYQLNAQEAAGLPACIIEDDRPNAIIGDSGRARSGATAPKLRVLPSQPAAAERPFLFLVQGQWSFLADQRFQQVDKGGNRLVLGADGKAEAFNRAGALVGALQDPALARVHAALLRLTM
jgi:hypothetical protein